MCENVHIVEEGNAMDSVLAVCIVQCHCLIKHNTTQQQLVQCSVQPGGRGRERER